MEKAMLELKESGKTPEELYNALCEQRVDLVFTAHPTQAMRGSVRKKYVNLFRDLRRMLSDVPDAENREIMEDMYANVQVSCATHTANTMPILHSIIPLVAKWPVMRAYMYLECNQRGALGVRP